MIVFEYIYNLLSLILYMLLYSIVTEDYSNQNIMAWKYWSDIKFI